MDKTNNNQIPEEFKPLFWDTEFNKLDKEKNKAYIISRLFSLGDIKEVMWIKENYSTDDIVEVIKKSRQFDEVTANYLSIKYNVDRKNMRFYQSPRLHWR